MTSKYLFAAFVAACLGTISCSSDAEQTTEQTTQRARVRLVCNTAPAVTMNAPSSRATLAANGKALTDIYIFDYNKATGALLQLLHQTSTATDFAEPELMLDYGEHTIRVVATRSTTPSLLDATGTVWTPADNVLTTISGTIPATLTATKTSDTFGASTDVSVGVGTPQAVTITLDRLVAQLVIDSKDTYPADCSTFDIALAEYRSISWADLSVIGSENNHRITDVSSLAGKAGQAMTYFVLVPAEGYTTDVTITTNSTAGTQYASITVPNFPFARNKVTTISGTFYNHQQGFSVALNDTWDAEGNTINI